MSNFSLPDLTRPKNEIVFLLAFISGVIVSVVEIVEGADWTQASSYTGAAIVILGIVQRLNAYGVETVEEFKRERDAAVD